MPSKALFILGIWISALAMSVTAGMISKYGFVDGATDSAMSTTAHIVWAVNGFLLSVGAFLTIANCYFKD